MFATCQVGAEATIKKDVEIHQPAWRLAFSRPGFLTFKLPLELQVSDEIGMPSVFVRSCGLSLGKVTGTAAEQRAAETWSLVSEIPFDRIHVWPRDAAAPGWKDFEPTITDEALDAGQLLCRMAPPERSSAAFLDATHRRHHVLDCILVEPNQWWLGIHQVNRRVQRWPGGIWTADKPAEMVSRSYLKMAEALDWVCWPIKPGQRCVELGCAPGGASQALLERGLRVVGIDPAAVDPRVLVHREFRHVRKRGADVKRRDFHEFQWLFADMNVAPSYTLATVGDIVSHRTTHIHGIILNLKLADWKLAEDLPRYMAQIRSWGYRRIRARQLSKNRQEICIAALKPPRLQKRRYLHSSAARRKPN